jgi:glutamate synthase (NADPH/NADH) small chain
MNTSIGSDISLSELQESFDSVVLTIGSKAPRNIQAPGRSAKGVHFAMDFLGQNNHRVAGETFQGPTITAENKVVLVIGGGDTGSDCIGTSLRQGAVKVIQVTIEEKPPVTRDPSNPWPEYPRTLKNSSSHEEGCERHWGLNLLEFVSNEQGNLVGASFEVVRQEMQNGRWSFVPTGERQYFDCDLAVLAIGFVHPEHEGLIDESKLSLDARGNIQTENYLTSIPGVFAAGDARRGQSLVVWAIAEGRAAAKKVNSYLTQD